MDGIMHKWDNPHLTILRTNRAATWTGVQDETNKYKLTQKGNNISDQMV